MEYNFWTYIVASDSGTLYIGMTNDLIRRIKEHKEGMIEWFSKKYGCKKLVYFEYTKYINNAIAREKQLKHFLRTEKEELIASINPSWQDLYPELLKS